MRRPLILLVAAVLLVVTPGCASGPAVNDPARPAGMKSGPTVRVGSMLDSEGTVLGSIVIEMLEANGIRTADRTKLGTPDVVREALLANEIDATIDYTGSGQYYHPGEEGDPKWKNAELAYQTIQKLDREVNGVEWLAPAPANNSEYIATTGDLARSEPVRTMEEFAAYVKAGKPVKLICSQAWADNPLGLKGFESAYGFTLSDDQLVALATGNTAEMLAALARGTDGVNFSLAYGTDGQLAELGLVILTDTKDVPPVYEPAPVFRRAIIEAYPEIPGILAPVFASLDQTTLQQLNAKVALGEQDGAAVARTYLEANGFLK